jgi:integrase
MKAWVYQDAKQVAKHGAEAASWYVGWYDPAGKRRCESCGPGSEGKRLAEKKRQKRAAELIEGTYQDKGKATWQEFRAEYDAQILPGLAVRTRDEVVAALAHFERIVGPKRMAVLVTNHIDQFIARRREDRGKKRGSLTSPATINKDLRHLRAVFMVAKEWKYLKDVPRFRMEKAPKKLATYTGPEHFAAIYQACEHATRPADISGIAPADWWRGLLVTAYMTGWRIGDLLGFRRADLDLDAGTAITRWEDNKGKRDEVVRLHPVVVDHLRRLTCFDPYVFPWNHYKTTLYGDFHDIQAAAGIKLHCPRHHEHTPACHVYGFHDLRRAFATLNADRLTPDALQALMRHKSYSTTQRYIAIAHQMVEAVESLHVPDVLKMTGSGQ